MPKSCFKKSSHFLLFWQILSIMYNVNLVVYVNLLFVNNLLTNEHFVVKITKFLAKYLKKRPMSGYFFFRKFQKYFRKQ